MLKTVIMVGPRDHGRRMSLADFDHAEVQPGYLYELGRGVVVVSDVPNLRHLAQVTAIKHQIHAYDLAHPGGIHTIATGAECKLLVWDLQSERHSDLCIYKKPPPQEDNPWTAWIPEIVMEVVSPSSEERDYEEKREEYLLFGVKEYWIFDAAKRELLVLSRSRAKWAERIIRPGKVHQIRWLPGLEFDCTSVFEAADAAGKK